MSTKFRSRQGLVVIPMEIFGPSGSTVLRVALDTGAVYTVASREMLMAIGYEPDLVRDRIQITTGSGLAAAPKILVQQLDALSQSRFSFPVLAYTLPSGAGVDGLLGLDFLRHRQLTIDFQSGEIILSDSTSAQ
jgi:predicted aspartyl protease